MAITTGHKTAQVDNMAGMVEQFDSITFGAGDCPDAYDLTKALIINAQKVRQGTILTRNIHASNVLTIKILGALTEAMPSSLSDNAWYTLLSDTDVPANNTAPRVDGWSDEWRWVVVVYQNKVPASAATPLSYARSIR